MNALMHLPPGAWALVAGAIVFGWIMAWLWGWYRRRRIHKALVMAVTSTGAEHLADVMVPDGMGGAFHLDFALLTPRGILVVDLRDVGGNIFGGDQMTEWTVMDGPRRFTFANPQSALYDRIAAVKALVGETPVEGRIVFTSRGRFPKGLPKWTLKVDSLRTEFPAVERISLQGVVDSYRQGWQRLVAAVVPSVMNQVKPLPLE